MALFFSKAGITAGVELKAISGIQTSDWEAVSMAIVSHIGDDSMTVTYSDENNIGVEVTKRLDLSQWNFDPEKDSPLLSLGFFPYRPALTLDVANVSSNSAAEKSGLLVGDRLVSVNGNALTKWQEMVDVIQGNPSKAVDLVISREGQTVDLVLIPDSKEIADGKVIGFAGVSPLYQEWPEATVMKNSMAQLLRLKKR